MIRLLLQVTWKTAIAELKLLMLIISLGMLVGVFLSTVWITTDTLVKLILGV